MNIPLLSLIASAVTPPKNVAARTVVEGPAQRPMSSFRAVTQNGTLDGIEQAAPLSAAAKNELHPKVLPPAPRDALEGVRFPSPENMRRIAVALEDYDLRDGIASAAEIEALSDCESRWQNLAATASRFTATAARADHRQHIDDLARRIANGDKTVGDDDAWDRSEYDSDYRLKLTSVKSEMRKIEAEAAALAKPIRIRFFRAVSELADILEGPGRHSAENFAMPFIPSNVILMLRKAAAVAADALTGGIGRPLAQVEFLNIAK